MRICSTDSKFGLHENVEIEEANVMDYSSQSLLKGGNKLVKSHEFHKEFRRSEERFSLKATSKSRFT